MTHPEVQERVTRVRRLAELVAAVAYATGAARDMAAGFNEGSGLDLEPRQAITYVVTMYYGGLVAASGRARLGDVRFAQQMLPFDRNLEDDSVAAAALLRYVGYPALDDLHLIVRELLQLSGARQAVPPGVDLQQDLEDLGDQARAAWKDPPLNAVVKPARRTAHRAEAKRGPNSPRHGVVPVLALAACLLALAMYYVLSVILPAGRG